MLRGGRRLPRGRHRAHRHGPRLMSILKNLVPPSPLAGRLALQSLLFAVGDGTFMTGSAVFFTQVVGLSAAQVGLRSEEHTSELQSLMRISYAVFCLKKKNQTEKYLQ